MVVAGLSFAGWLGLRASLPLLDGTHTLAGLENPVSIERDHDGVPTLQASNRWDAARGLGFLHAQDRFFQMDLLRRRGAGELAELFGPNLVPLDTDVRRHRFRATARTALESLPPAQRTLLTAYAEGVNAGLASLKARPPEYTLLQSEPAPWTPEDSLLVAFSMFLSLQDSTGHEDYRRTVLEQALPREAVEFFYPAGSSWDAPIDDCLLPLPGPPPANVLNVRDAPAPPAPAQARAATESAHARIPGSNSWGVPGDLSATGSAILANDMHLDLGVPNIWYRAELRWNNAQGQSRWVLGVTLPGVPLVVVGCTADLAWTFTNATLDTTDLVRLEFDPDNPRRYRTPEGWQETEPITEILRVRGEAPRLLTVEQTLWGPIVRWGPDQAPHALRWIPQEPGAMNMRLVDLEECRTVAEALDLAPDCGIPVQNLLVGDRHGTLAWTLIGRLPCRAHHDGRQPVAGSLLHPADSRHFGWLEPKAYPRHIATPGERLWTANHRILGTPEYLALGPRETDLGARARQIRDDLRALPAPVGEADLFSIFLDDRAHLLVPWQHLLVATLQTGKPGHPAARWAEMLAQVEGWQARAATNSVGYRLVRAFRHRVIEHLWEPVTERVRKVDLGLSPSLARAESAAWSLLELRPTHLLPPRFDSYDALLAEAVHDVLTDLDAQKVPLPAATWGQRNLARIQHPLSLALPRLARWLDMPVTPMPGDDHMPRIQAPDFGPSQRLVVSPGHQRQGLFNMPGGQSGHFLSPFYRAGHQAWIEVTPTPLAPGPTRHRLTLAPERSTRP